MVLIERRLRFDELAGARHHLCSEVAIQQIYSTRKIRGLCDITDGLRSLFLYLEF